MTSITTGTVLKKLPILFKPTFKHADLEKVKLSQFNADRLKQ